MKAMRPMVGNRMCIWCYRRSQPLALLFVFLISMSSIATHANGTNVSIATSRDDIGETFLIQFQPDTPMERRAMLIEAMDGAMVRWLAPIHVAEVAIHDDASARILRQHLLTRAKTQPDIAYIERDGVVRGVEMPNDPDLVDETLVYTPALLGLDRAWAYTMGSEDVIIAVLDTGIALEHKEFQGRILPGIDIVNGDDDPSDDNGHGTHVSGIAAAAIDNEFGAAGVCGHCRILPIKVLDSETDGTWTDIAEGLIYAVEHEADIVILSLGDEAYSETAAEAIRYAIQNDVFVVAAAGNKNSDKPFYPAAFDDVIGVAATNANDNRWLLSNYGDYIDISAPGDGIYATWHELDNVYHGHTVKEGTSAAAPHVAGAAGLLLSMDPARTPMDLTRILLQSALDIEEPGADPQSGKGRLDPVAALELELDDAFYAQLSGVVWVDSDADTTMGTAERIRMANVQIQIQRRSRQDPPEVVYTDESGEWHIDRLGVDDYLLRIIEPEGYTTTTETELTLSLNPGEHRQSLNFGIVEKSVTHETFLPILVKQ